MMQKLLGCGLPNVYLVNGFASEESDGECSTTYEDLDSLYSAIARAIALSKCALTGAEVRFLRKRLHLSQDELGEEVGKGNQAIAKWEKDENPVPTSDARVIRMLWLARFAADHLVDLAQCGHATRAMDERIDYVFVRHANQWAQDAERGIETSKARASNMANTILDSARTSAKTGRFAGVKILEVHQTANGKALGAAS